MSSNWSRDSTTPGRLTSACSTRYSAVPSGTSLPASSVRRRLEASKTQRSKANRKSVRASIALGDLERAAGNLERAIEHWQRVESQNPAYLALVAPRLLDAYRQAARLEAGLTLLAGYLERYPSLDLLDTAPAYSTTTTGCAACLTTCSETDPRSARVTPEPRRPTTIADARLNRTA